VLSFEAPLVRIRRGNRVYFGAQAPPPKRRRMQAAARNLALGYRIVRAVEQGEVRDFMAASRSMGVSDAWVSMLVSLTFLAPELQEGILRGDIRLEVNRLVQVARRADWREQRALLERLLARREEGATRGKGRALHP